MEIKFFDAGCGDAIHIRFLGDDGLYHNILIDGGSESEDIYTNSIRKEIEKIVQRSEIIDLWIITHIDDDHIGGILRLINDETIFSQLDISKTKVWYNYSQWDYDTGIRNTNLKSVRQGIKLREFLSKHAHLNEFITDELGVIDFWGARITLLSPDSEKLKKMIIKWKREEIKIVKKKSAEKKAGKKNDYKTKLEDFNLELFKEDNSEENGSSIAFILTFNGSNFLFLADSHPSVISRALKNLGYLPGEKKIELAYMQVSHHGSKFNTSDLLLDLINCGHFIVSADGLNKNNLPNKETLVRIIRHNSKRNLQFHITQKNRVTTSIFDVDGKIENVSILYPEAQNNYLTFNL
ncbi:ComEC/Rec2 family competence protein [Chitinophaga arvensicola]|uniref:Metal-dependent hydrolase, beta-lactamase superfamily II n=1 Tax=Chitinophaga arvensicola TaxID=29529 RepID=A0A1I0SDR8_9BACT|nr:hypothetical protein [Chitinophaga arvensicola]SEW56406.1 Metal-dependent hydrolase, beta-lactamase superfamily II [Chitinophaga arvensicola]